MTNKKVPIAIGAIIGLALVGGPYAMYKMSAHGTPPTAQVAAVSGAAETAQIVRTPATTRRPAQTVVAVAPAVKPTQHTTALVPPVAFAAASTPGAGAGNGRIAAQPKPQPIKRPTTTVAQATSTSPHDDLARQIAEWMRQQQRRER